MMNKIETLLLETLRKSQNEDFEEPELLIDEDGVIIE